MRGPLCCRSRTTPGTWTTSTCPAHRGDRRDAARHRRLASHGYPGRGRGSPAGDSGCARMNRPRSAPTVGHEHHSREAGSGTGTTVVVSGGGLLVLPTIAMLVLRRKYSRWWFDFNLYAWLAILLTEAKPDLREATRAQQLGDAEDGARTACSTIEASTGAASRVIAAACGRPARPRIGRARGGGRQSSSAATTTVAAGLSPRRRRPRSRAPGTGRRRRSTACPAAPA